MAEIVQFPAKRRLTKAPPEAAQIVGLRADLFLMPGGQMAYSIRYANGKVARSVAADLLRRAADSLDPKGEGRP